MYPSGTPLPLHRMCDTWSCIVAGSTSCSETTAAAAAATGVPPLPSSPSATSAAAGGGGGSLTLATILSLEGGVEVGRTDIMRHRDSYWGME